MTTLSFWLLTLAVLLPQGPAVLAHNRLDWASFWRGPSSSPELSQITVGALFLLSLVLLVTLHRIAELRRLRGRLGALRLESGGTGQGHRQRDSSPGRVGWVQPVRNRNATVSGCGVGPDEQPAGPFSLDSTHHRRCRPFDGNCLLAPLAANSPRGLTPALPVWMQHLAAAVTTTKPHSPRTELCGTIGMWPSTFSAFATGYPPASKSTAHEYRSFPLRLIRNHEIPPPSLAS